MLANENVLRVGVAEGDIRGNDQRAIQGAIEYLASVGGGVVELGSGEYILYDSIQLRSGVHLRGAGRGTVLRMANAVRSPLYSDAGFGETEFTPTDATGFAVGKGVTLSARGAGGYHTIVATIIGRQGNTFMISKECVTDYSVDQEGYAATVFPMISGIGITGITISDLTLDGNRANTFLLNGCRGGGIYFYNCADIVIRNCVVDNYNGDGISWQKSARVTLEQCECTNNAGHGVHPGTGSHYTVVRNCRFDANGGSGLFVCWRVKYGEFIGNHMRHNRQAGISIGHQDTDNVFAQNVIEENEPAGVYFRRELEPMGAHRNRIVENRIVNNGGVSGKLAVHINGITHDLVFAGNEIGDTRSQDATGIYMQSGVERVDVQNNTWVGLLPERMIVSAG